MALNTKSTAKILDYAIRITLEDDRVINCREMGIDTRHHVTNPFACCGLIAEVNSGFVKTDAAELLAQSFSALCDEAHEELEKAFRK